MKMDVELGNIKAQGRDGTPGGGGRGRDPASQLQKGAVHELGNARERSSWGVGVVGGKNSPYSHLVCNVKSMVEMGS